MPQTLTKPVLLDETGQDIAEKLDTNGEAIVEKLGDNNDALVEILDDIKDAISTSSEFIPIAIRVTTPPTKTKYASGENLDLTGIVVNLVASNGAMIDVTDMCTFVPANGAALTSANTSIAVSYYYPRDTYTFTATQNINVYKAEYIVGNTEHAKTNYKAGEALDLTGLVVEAYYPYIPAIKDVTSQCTFNPADGTILAFSDDHVEISYTEEGTTLTANAYFRVDQLRSIQITNPPTTTQYVTGDTLDLTGIEVTATYTDNSTAVVTSSCSFSPADGATLSASDTNITASYTEGGITKTDTTSITVEQVVYGAEWDGTSSSAWTRTDMAADFVDPIPYYSGMSETPSSPFDDIMPWAGMEIVNDTDAGALVKIPKYYYKLTVDGRKLKIQISSSAKEGYSVSPAHMDRGDGEGERGYVYVGRYHIDNNNFKSSSGVIPYSNTPRGNFRTIIHSLGADIWQWDFAMVYTIWMLYLVEFADWNSQSKISYGCCSNTNARQVMGGTDTMPYHTGTMASAKTTYTENFQYRYIESLWGNVNDFVDGIYYNTNGYNIIINPADFSDTTGGTWGGTWGSSYGYPTKFSISSPEYPMFVPTSDTTGGNENTYTCDSWDKGGSNPVMLMGANYAQSLQYGLFYIQFFATGTSGKNARFGSRLMKLPANS